MTQGGMVTHNSGQSAVGLRCVKEEQNMAPKGEAASEWKKKLTLFDKNKIKLEKKKIKTFAPECEWKNQTGNRRLRVFG